MRSQLAVVFEIRIPKVQFGGTQLRPNPSLQGTLRLQAARP